MIELPIHEQSIQLLEKYCSKRPAETPLIIERIAREWYARPHAIMLHKVRGRRLTKVGVNAEIARTFTRTAQIYNMDRGELLSHLTAKFINRSRIEQRGKYHEAGTARSGR